MSSPGTDSRQRWFVLVLCASTALVYCGTYLLPVIQYPLASRATTRLSPEQFQRQLATHLNDVEQAERWLEQTAQQGEPEAQYALGNLLVTGDASGKLAPDWIAAYAWLTLAGQGGEVKAFHLRYELQEHVSPAQIFLAEQQAAQIKLATSQPSAHESPRQ